MKKLAELTYFLTQLNLVAAENITPYVDKVQFSPSGKIKGATVSADSCVICRKKYTALIDIERYPHKDHAPDKLFAHVSAWLIDNDSERYDMKDAEPEMIVDVLDDFTADVLIEVDFSEEVKLLEDSAGEIHLGGKRWRLI